MPLSLNMSVKILSDLHLEFIKAPAAVNAFIDGLIDERKVDVLIMAGDVAGHSGVAYALARFRERFDDVLYVPGNHEFYGTSFVNLRDTLAKIAAPGLHLLDNGVVEIQGHRFVGSTLWFPDDPLSAYYCSRLNDFHRIEDFAETVYEENRRSVEFLQKHVMKGDIVITHHLPSGQSVADRFRSNPLNRFFLCEMDELILDREPRLWIHGHSHDSCDYTLGTTRVICNPFGYPSIDENPGFNPGLVVAVED